MRRLLPFRWGSWGKLTRRRTSRGGRPKKDEVAEQNADKLAQAEMDKSLAWSEKAESFAEELETLRANPDAKESDVNALVALARQATDAGEESQGGGAAGPCDQRRGAGV